VILRLEVPFLETFSNKGMLTKWHVQPGDKVEFGDAICDIALSEWRALRKTKRAINIVKVRDENSKIHHEFENRSGRGVLNLRVVASESAYIRQIDIPTGTKAGVGDLLALVSTDRDEPVVNNPEAPTMRVVATSPEVMEGTS
jgi:pyruvate/2-oxoglutarate dehydrogenase complex dihydrolipoamide acyltransferase (E2) component